MTERMQQRLHQRSVSVSYTHLISPELHRTIAIYAMEHGKSLNAAVEEAIDNMVKL